jgi:hypothetical protein
VNKHAPDANDIHREDGETALREASDHSVKERRNKPRQRDAAAVSNISLEDFYAYLPQHKYIFAPTRDVWPAAGVNARLPAIMRPDNSKPISPAQWLDENRRVEQMTWAPGLPELIRGKLICDGGFVDQPDCSAFNLYLPPTIKPVAGDVTPWLELVHIVG